MTRHPFAVCLARWIAAILVGGAGIAAAQAPPPYVFSGPLLPLLLQMPENSWLHANANLYSNVWTSPSLEPLDGCCTQPPSKIIAAWSGFAWDSNRGDLILWGGGHANYPGNDVYRWHSSTLLWERAALPSEIKTDPVLAQIAIDGVDNAPISSHTYDNNRFLPVADRFITWGGAAYDNGGPFIRPLESNPTQARLTGPYLFNPNLADGNKVGGSTGSNVRRVLPAAITGGQMWQNRDIHRWLAGQPLPGTHVQGCTGYATEGGLDVVYVASANWGATSLNLYRYQLTTLATPALDQIAKVGAYAVGVAGQTTCGYDPVRKLFVRTGNNTTPFQFWDLTTAGPFNPDKSVQGNASIAALQSWLAANSLNLQFCGLEYDPTRGRFLLWCGAGVMWEVTPPAAGNTPTGWTVTQRPPPPAAAPPGDLQTGILGKWRYVPYYDAFVGLQDINDGDIWIYKPVGWVQPNPPGNVLPSVTITAPTAGTTVAPATPLNLQATASDPDGGIARVEYYLNGTKVGQATTPPYTVNIAPILVGSYAVIAVAVDTVGGMTASAAVPFTVSATLTTSVLQRGLAGYAGVSDTYLDAFAPTVVRGAATGLNLDPATYRPLVRFAIFQSEGGPVPNGAVIQSATLALYKQYYNDTLQLNALLKPWVEAEATWTTARAGVPWSVGGASGAGTDYNTTTDALVTPSFNPGWVSFDVTARVRTWASGANFGWRMMQTTSGGNSKVFTASESTTDTTLRPKLTVVWSGGTSNLPPTVSLTSPTAGAAITLGQSFTLTASASDPDGTVTKVAFYANGTLIGTDTAAPYTLAWTPGAVGSYALTAVATDNSLATTTSAAINVTVNPVATGTTVVLQRGLSGYAGASDTYLDRYLPTTVRGALGTMLVDPVNYNSLLRFSIYQSEGGPVPNGAVIQSATLALYKQYYNDTLRLNALLKPWVEAEATWTTARAGVPWSAGGASGAGTDYSATTDALVTPSFNPGWVSFDVTARVRTWASGANFGWRMMQTTSGGNSKVFTASESTTDTTLRPKLTVVWSGGTSNLPPTVSLTSPTAGAAITLGQSFTLTASASDPDGTVTKVAFYANGTLIGTDTAAPYTLAWTPGAVGSYALTAVATDNSLATTTSAAINVTVNPVATGTTVVLQRGLSGYAGASDTYLDRYLPTTVRGALGTMLVDPVNYNSLLRFSIYQSEGGPVPNGAVIQSATLALYKQYYNDTLRLNALLKPWVEAEATWTTARAGVPWSAGGASGAGTDYSATTDALVTPSFNPGWVSFDVTARVRTWASGANFGWRMMQTTSGGNSKVFTASESTADTTLRPQLTITYQ